MTRDRNPVELAMLRVAVENMRREKALRDAAPELLTALKWSLTILDEIAKEQPSLAPFTLGAIDPRDMARAALRKAEAEGQ